jgi:cell division protein FtsN
MAKTSPRLSSRPGRRAGRGGILMGLLIGLLVGLALAVAVALFMSRSSVPFTDRGKRPDKVTEPMRGDELPDPNRNAAKVIPPPPPVIEPPRDSSTDAPADTPAPAADGSAATPGAVPVPNEPSSAPVAAPVAPVDDKSAYVLQVGAFKGQEDAEAMKGKLALIGFEARIQTAEVNGVTFYRVRVGPYGQADDMIRARTRLAENGVDATVMRQQR